MHGANQQQQLTQWQQPPMGWVKCNIDVGFGSDLNKTSAGWIVIRERLHGSIFYGGNYLKSR
jgi:hypothetical protein